MTHIASFENRNAPHDEGGEESSSFASDAFENSFTSMLETYQFHSADEPSNAPMPDPSSVQRATEMLVATIFDVMRDSRMETYCGQLAWGMVHAIHKVALQVEREADKAAGKVRTLVREADGSEIGTLALEEAQRLCRSLDEAHDALACMRDHAAQCFHSETGRPWSAPRATLVSSKRTASVIAAQDFLAARRQRKASEHHPEGPVVIFSGGQKWEDHGLLYQALDGIYARIPSMILATTAQERGCDAIAAAWAAARNVRLIAFTLDRSMGRRAGFARNEAMIRLRPVEALVCEGSGIQSNLARLVRAAAIPARFFRLQDQKSRHGQ